MENVERRTRIRRFVRYALGSFLATLVSAVVFALAYRVAHLGPQLTSVCAFTSGAVVNFLLNRFWAWDRWERIGLGRDLASYAVVAIATALTAAAVTTATQDYAPRFDPLAAHLALVVEVSYFGTYAAMFLVKFMVLDRLVFRPRAGVEKTTRP
jgi:putative flippase GtrA